MQTLEEIVKQRQADFRQEKANRAAADELKDTKRRSARKRDFSALERDFNRQATAAEKASPDTREGHTRRNHASALDATERQGRILCVLKYFNDKHGNNYSFPRQETILLMLKRWYGLTMSRRTLNRDLNAMEARGQIRRKRRLSWSRFSSTIYYVTKMGAKWWAALQKAFGFFKSHRVPNLAHKDALLCKEGLYTADGCAVPPDRQALNSPCGTVC